MMPGENRTVRVLLIEDDEDDYVLAHELFDAMPGHYALAWANSYATAIDALSERAFDVVLLDCQLGARNGLDLLHEIQTPDVGCPVLMLTGSNDRSTDLAAMSAGASDYLTKENLDGPGLERAIRYALERWRLQHKLESYSRELREREAQLRSIMTQSPSGIVVTGGEGEVLFANPTAELFLGKSETELTGRPLELPGEPDSIEVPICLEQGNGVAELREVDIEWGGAQGSLITLVDITQRKQAEATVIQQAMFDELTGLANRSQFQDFLARALPRALRNDSLVALLFLDLDHFKQVNDRLGHDAGDALIRGVAQRIEACLRGSDLSARLGGDEFALVIDGIHDVQAAGRVADKILGVLDEPFRIAGSEIRAQVSIGIAAYPADAGDADGLVKAADTAMYEAKRLGRNNYQYFAREMQEHAVMRSILEFDLDQALRSGQFELFYQPQLDTRTRRLTGVEALLRWHHDRRGLLTPESFLSVAEDSGKIMEMGRWAMMQACRQLQAWRKSGLGGPFTMAVNVSMSELKRDSLVDRLVDAVSETGIDPRDLEIELTESAIMHDPDEVIVQLQQLHEIGARISIDKFGTGYSSLQYLASLPLDALKIDRSFVHRIDSGADGTIVRATIQLAHNLGLQVVAEGVETREQADYLVHNGCELLQGRLIGDALPAHEFRSMHVPSSVIALDAPMPAAEPCRLRASQIG